VSDADEIDAKSKIGKPVVVIVDGRVLEVFGVYDDATWRVPARMIEVRDKGADRKGNLALQLHPDILGHNCDVFFSPDQADECRRLVDALVAAGATRV